MLADCWNFFEKVRAYTDSISFLLVMIGGGNINEAWVLLQYFNQAFLVHLMLYNAGQTTSSKAEIWSL